MFEESWKLPKTTKLYLHPPYCSRLVLMTPDFKLIDLDLDIKGAHLNQKGYAVTLLGSDGNQLDYEKSEFGEIVGDCPKYSLSVPDPNGAIVTLESYCGFGELPVCYSKVTVGNPGNVAVRGSVTLFPRTSDHDEHLTGFHDTGYDIYIPNVKDLYTLPSLWKPSGNTATDSYGGLRVNPGKFALRWVTSEEQPDQFAASDCFELSYSLEPGEKKSFDFSISRGELGDGSFDSAYGDFRAAWDEILSHVAKQPDVTAPRLSAMFRQMVIQSMQMFAKYRGDGDWIYPRQGDIGRFIWAWEAAHLIIPLDRIGMTDYTYPAVKMLVERWCVTDPQSPNLGKIDNPNVNWGNTNGSVLWCASEHLCYSGSRERFDEFKPYLDLILGWMERERAKSAETEGCVAGLFPTGKASDWGELGQHWTYTDAVNVMGERAYLKACEKFGADDTEYVRACCDSYGDAVKNALAIALEGHENDECFMPTHILGHDFESIRTHCFYTDGCPYLYLTGALDADSKVFDQMETYYEKHHLFVNGLAGRMTNYYCTPCFSGDIYYVGDAEINWIYVWLERSRTGADAQTRAKYRAKADEMIGAMLRYGVSKEFVTSERYCSRCEWYSPWSPNASGNGRVIMLLLDRYGEIDLQN